MKLAKCTMCDFRKKSEIQPADVTGSIFRDDEEPQDLDYVVGCLSLQKSLGSYYILVTVSGADPNGELTAAFTIKIPTKTCPNCGRVLGKEG